MPAAAASAWLDWSAFAACAALIALAGAELSRSGDVISERTGLSGSWIGLVLLATVTSLPELATGASAVTIADEPNIAVGNALGACVLNLAILVVIDFLHRGESVYRKARQGHVLSAGFGTIVIGFVGMNLLLRDHPAAVAIAHVGIYTPILALLYLFAMRTVFFYEKAERERATEALAQRYPHVSLQEAVIRYAVAGIVVTGAGIALPFVADGLAGQMGWNKTFVATLLVALATSLPELVVTISAVRIGAVDLAVANLLGSNLFDMLILAFDDVLYVKGPILSHVSPFHAVSAMSAVIMNGIAIIGLFYRPRARLFGLVGWVGLALFAMYLLNAYVLYLRGT